MENRGITFGYGFLSQESSFDVQFSLIEFDGSHSYFRAYLVGLLNTILVSVIGIIFATIIGMSLGGWLSGEIYDYTNSYQMAFLNGIFWNMINLSIMVYLFLKYKQSIKRVVKI